VAAKKSAPKRKPTAKTASPSTEVLNERQQRFIQEYLLDLNATQAYIRAGYSAKGARANAAALIANHNIAAAIAAEQDARAERTGRTQDAVLDRLEHLSRGAEAAGDFAPAIRATELVGKHLGMFADRGEMDLQLKGSVLQDVTHQIIGDPEAARLAHDLLGRIADVHAGGAGVQAEPGTMDTSASPSSPQPGARRPGRKTHHTAHRGDATKARKK